MTDVVIVCGSKSDFSFAEKIQKPLEEKNLSVELFAASAHKEPKKVLEIVEKFGADSKTIFVTIAGRSNALSGFIAANSKNVTIACPPFADKNDYLVNIHSTLQMPSKTPVLTVIDPGNCVLAVERILNSQK
ncbi:AIR carboxylase family protein [bacterium]|jgi:5-(carboxyamino)imidazole ribonucleotide mutase|nr:AIR carboxylase family protein [bacterium]MBT6996473.1 AIR carboxylase family protein [bacterium]MBT7772509.1 AIR carboxylase family protein [bacterium]